jgi:hypothetical protein
MPTVKSPADEFFDWVVREAVTAVLKSAGFRKSGMNYHRRRGTCVQVVNVQVSRLSTRDEKRFYVNVGLAFDELCSLAHVPILEKPKEYECDARGTRDRLQDLIPGNDEDWHAGPQHDVAETVERLRGAMATLVAELDRIDGPAAYRSHRWFDRFRPKAENAQVLYVLGDRAAALEEVERLAAFFADRQNANGAEWWITSLGLQGLVPRITK